MPQFNPSNSLIENPQSIKFVIDLEKTPFIIEYDYFIEEPNEFGNLQLVHKWEKKIYCYNCKEEEYDQYDPEDKVIYHVVVVPTKKRYVVFGIDDVDDYFRIEENTRGLIMTDRNRVMKHFLEDFINNNLTNSLPRNYIEVTDFEDAWDKFYDLLVEYFKKKYPELRGLEICEGEDVEKALKKVIKNDNDYELFEKYIMELDNWEDNFDIDYVQC